MSRGGRTLLSLQDWIPADLLLVALTEEFFAGAADGGAQVCSDLYMPRVWMRPVEMAGRSIWISGGQQPRDSFVQQGDWETHVGKCWCELDLLYIYLPDLRA